MKLLTTADLFYDQLADLYSVEKQLTHALPRLAIMASHPELREVLLRHSLETESQRETLRRLFHHGHRHPVHDPSKAMQGLLEGGEAHLSAVKSSALRDLLMVAHCLRIEHYEVAAYDFITMLTRGLGLEAEMEVLSTLLAEEQAVLERLEDLQTEILVIAKSLDPIVRA